MKRFQLPKSRKIYVFDKATGKMVERKPAQGEMTIERLWVPEGATTGAPGVLDLSELSADNKKDNEQPRP